MRDFDLQPAKDLGLTPFERALSLRREGGLITIAGRKLWWGWMRLYFKAWHRLRVTGKEHLPEKPPYVLVANHTSHLDALAIAASLRARDRDRVFPIAAGDVFFETPITATFAMACLNALPLWRHNCGRHALTQLRQRLVEEPCIFILFPEGTRSEDGTLGQFKPGLGMMIAETNVPVVPCHLRGAFEAWPRNRRLPRPVRIELSIGKPLDVAGLPNRREGWEQITAQCREAVEALSRR